MISQMYTLIVLACFVVVVMMIIFKKGNNNKTKYIRWGLGVDCISFYSSRFTVSKKGVTIVGFQEVLDGQSPILYLVVKQNWWGGTQVYGQAVVYGNYKNPNFFKKEISNIPIGEDYRIKVVSHCNISKGKFKILND